jgi:PKD repeat protein
MKKHYILSLAIIICGLFTTMLNAQTWQWGKSGGSFQQGNGSLQDERAKTLTTDSHGNVYLLSPVQPNGLKVDGINKEGYGSTDYMIATFSCNGDYRWSRVIGGGNSDLINRVQTDGQDNVYATGNISRSQLIPGRFGTEVNGVYDTIMPYSLSSVNTNKQTLFIVKYNTEGVKQWIRMPHAADVSFVNGTYSISYDLQTDANGISHWLVGIPAGTYANGAFINTDPDNYRMFIFKYDTDGNFMEAVPIGMNAFNGDNNLRMKRNHTTGEYYICSNISQYDSGVTTINGELVAPEQSYIAVFNAEGDFQWKIIQDASISELYIDTDGFLYVTGGTRNGKSLAGHTFVSPTGSTFPYVAKLTNQGELVWATNATSLSANGANALTVNGSEVAIAGSFGGDLIWQGQTMTQLMNEGYDVLLARFNKSDGTLVEMTDIEGNFGYWDYGTAITADPFGNYYFGGKFDNFLYINETTTLVDGAQSYDFFLAKYGTDTCSCSPPQAAFNAAPGTVEDFSSTFTYSGDTYDSISWDFGDGNTSAVANPEHTFSGAGSYTVCVTVANACGTSQYCQQVTATLGVHDFELAQVTVYPNPVTNVLNVVTARALSYSLHSVIGVEVLNGSITQGASQINVGQLAAGTYLLVIKDSNGQQKTIKVFKE